MLIVSVRGGQNLGNGRLCKEEGEEIEVRFVRVRRGEGISNERGRSSSANQKLACRYPPRATCLPVVDVWCGERDTIGVLDIEIGLNTRRRLGIQATINKDDAEGGADGISAERLVESLRHGSHKL